MKIFKILTGLLSLMPLIAMADSYNLPTVRPENLTPANQTIAFHFPQGAKPWKTVNAQSYSSGFTLFFIPKNQEYATFTEIIGMAIIPYKAMPGINAAKYMELEMNTIRQACQQVNSKIIKKTRFSINYALNVAGCGNGNQRQITKIFNGSDAVYVIRYSAVIGKVSDLEFKSMSKVIQTSRLVSNPMLKR